ncbi:6 protein [Cacao swollen shoot Togo A virus]|uniref:Protein 6 n=3 Tax=Riboviria TaxID=2559587 RepID=VP6_NCMV|nr:unnamed protein product; gene 6 protein [Cytorhabdovirus gramineae]YP_009506258.1 6 protein [Cacao swollen shoot Togo A virus]Q9JGT6.1 RecName: Full=Protein 6 [Cytorhabdovirus gramineae]ADE61674.1 6 protein [Cacao swollen shoot Togo A virus]BAA95349.1 6 [Cytorhabdovirus gramineae] [Cytorhabdovirus gramineae]BCW02949.1 protein 6 [Cytorhabdovirus gramineae]
MAAVLVGSEVSVAGKLSKVTVDVDASKKFSWAEGKGSLVWKINDSDLALRSTNAGIEVKLTPKKGTTTSGIVLDLEGAKLTLSCGYKSVVVLFELGETPEGRGFSEMRSLSASNLSLLRMAN